MVLSENLYSKVIVKDVDIVVSLHRFDERFLNLMACEQAISTVDSRQEVYKYLAVKNQIDLSNKHVLLVDDIYTTGATMKSAITLVEKLNPKSIKVLVVAKTKPKHSNTK